MGEVGRIGGLCYWVTETLVMAEIGHHRGVKRDVSVRLPRVQLLRVQLLRKDTGYPSTKYEYSEYKYSEYKYSEYKYSGWIPDTSWNPGYIPSILLVNRQIL